MEVVELPSWLRKLRKAEIIDTVRNDPRSRNDTIFGLNKKDAFDVIRGGTADFTEPHGDISTDDMAVIYAYLNQLGHLEELIEAFSQIFAQASPNNPVVVDLGSGPFTGGLALASTLGEPFRFDYVGVDRASSMRRLGEHLASSVNVPGEITRQWVSDVADVNWQDPPGWRDVIVIASYLFASSSLDAVSLFDSLQQLLIRIGRGRVTLLYTNSVQETHNMQLEVFRAKLIEAGFYAEAEGYGEINAERTHRTRKRRLRYALFHRPRQKHLKLS